MKKNKPSAYEVNKILEKWLTDMVPLDKLDAKELDLYLYHYPQKVLNFYSQREQKLRNKQLTGE